MFIPMGGGPPMHPAIGLPIIIGCGVAIYYMLDDTPKFKIMLKPYENISNIINLHIKKIDGYPDETYVTHKNIECLKNKGYIIKKEVDNKSRIYNSIFDKQLFCTITSNKKDINKETFIADCSECKVSTEIKYRYETLIRKKTKVGSQTINWEDCFEDNLQ